MAEAESAQRPMRNMQIGFIMAIVPAALVGIAMGLAGFTFVYANGASYLSDDPKACANCHIMQQQFDGWIHSSHRSAASCNDCHTPPGLVSKYMAKASNGFWHSFAFTTGRFPEPIRIKPHNERSTEGSCRGCHQEIVSAIEASSKQPKISCIRCHSEVGHRS